jgi:MoCo/4Fe-4S cofactor protein with predicted Tat translocation signal
MKSIPVRTTKNGTGRKYWRSLDELAETPEFRQWLEREFPEGASELNDSVSRRHFVKIMSASFLLAGVGLAGTGCRRPEQKILPFTRLPENYVHGVAQYFATSTEVNGTTTPLVVKSHDGRPIKIEGNNLHPDSAGGTDRFTQASILNLYDPDRAMQFKERGSVRTAEAAFDALNGISKKARDSKGEGLAVLMERSNSPSRRRLESELRKTLPKAQWFIHDPVDLDVHRRAAAQAFGKPVRPRFLFDKAGVVVSLDCDFLGSEADLHNNIRRFSSRRHLEKAEDGLNRLYVLESLYSLTGINADHRLRLPSSAVAQVAKALLSAVNGATVETLPAGVDPKWITECAKDLSAHRGKGLVVAGHRQPMAVHVLAHALNAALGNVGQTVVFLDAPEPPTGTLVELAQALKAGQVDTLIILGSNPAYTGPADVEWTKVQASAKTVVRLGYYEDETFPLCQWHLPQAHFLESWGDSITSDGTLVPVQPLIAPLFGGLTELEVLARLAGMPVTDPYTIARDTFATFTSGDVEAGWRKYLHDGFLADSAPKPASVSLDKNAVNQAASGIQAAAPTPSSLELVFHRDYSVDDGRYNNNGWLQEMPDPITKIVWDNVVLLSRKTASQFQVKNHDVVEIKLGNRTISGPIWVQPGMADFSIGLALGYGRERTGRVGHGTGFNVYPLRTSSAQGIALGATIRPLGKTHPISCTQSHWSMDGRPAVREANLEQFGEHPDFAKKMNMEEEEPVSMYPSPFEKLKLTGHHQWGMAIDLNMCVGCSACMMACQSENNIPIVGKDQVRRGREMHWIRIDRYYTGRPLAPEGSAQASKNLLQSFKNEELQQFAEWIDNPQVVTQPMLCQHCEAAPCENVCPVNATSHDQEGLNVMTYNRCVGTRYCSNNCPYKVRRFNFFDYNKRPLDKLYLGPLAKRPDDEWDLVRMIKNPDVTVRMRGVMEKCTFCIQRIESAKIAQKVKAGASNDVVVPEGTFTTACAQACPAGAIVFGNLNDEHSRVSRLKTQTRNYTVLDELYTRPRTTYLARVRNPNPAMPDYTPAPMSFQEYEQRMGNPFKHEDHGEPAGAAGHGEAGKGAH